MKEFTLNTNQSIPQLGLGTWELTGDECIKSVGYALSIGYEQIDTADAYGNHSEIAKGIKESGITREDFFLTSKVWRSNLSKQDLIDSCKRNLDELQTNYLDLYLVHWPNRQIPMKETMDGMEEIKEMGLVKSWGVSNFTTHHLQDVLDAGYKPSNNQVEFHPTFYQKELLEFCKQNNIILTSYSPLGRGDELQMTQIKSIAESHGASEAAVILSWIMGKGCVVIPKATSKEHLKDNLESIDLELDAAEIEIIDELNTNNRIVNPGFADFDY